MNKKLSCMLLAVTVLLISSCNPPEGAFIYGNGEKIDSSSWMSIYTKSAEDGGMLSREAATLYQSYLDSGYSVVSSIDLVIQDICDSLVRVSLTEMDAELGMAVVVDVKTGDIKAIADLERNDKDYSRTDNVFTLSMDGVNMIKPASLLLAMEHGNVNLDDNIDLGNGKYILNQDTIFDHNWKRGGYGTITIRQILGLQSDIGIAKICNGIFSDKVEEFVSGLRQSGFTNEGSNVNVYNLAPVFNLDYGKENAEISVAHLSIGLNLNVSPIHIVSYFNGIANCGEAPSVRLANKYIDTKGQTHNIVPTFTTISDSESANKLSQCLTYCVEEGLSRYAKDSLVSCAGMYGTSIDKDGKIHTFCGYFPAEDPRYTCYIAFKSKNGEINGPTTVPLLFSKLSKAICIIE